MPKMLVTIYQDSTFVIVISLFYTTRCVQFQFFILEKFFVIHWFVNLLLFSNLIFQATKAFKRVDVDKKREELDKVKTKFGLHEEMKKWYLLSRPPVQLKFQNILSYLSVFYTTARIYNLSAFVWRLEIPIVIITHIWMLEYIYYLIPVPFWAIFEVWVFVSLKIYQISKPMKLCLYFQQHLS